MSVSSIPTNDVHNKSYTHVSATMLWPSSIIAYIYSGRNASIRLVGFGWNRRNTPCNVRLPTDNPTLSVCVII